MGESITAAAPAPALRWSAGGSAVLLSAMTGPGGRRGDGHLPLLLSPSLPLSLSFSSVCLSVCLFSLSLTFFPSLPLSPSGRSGRNDNHHAQPVDRARGTMYRLVLPDFTQPPACSLPLSDLLPRQARPAGRGEGGERPRIHEQKKAKVSDG